MCRHDTRQDLRPQKARTTHGIIIERLDKLDNQMQNWHQALIEDRHATPADIAVARIDVAAWLRSLSQRNRRIAETLALGNTSSETRDNSELPSTGQPTAEGTAGQLAGFSRGKPGGPAEAYLRHSRMS